MYYWAKVSAVHRATNVSRPRIYYGLKKKKVNVGNYANKSKEYIKKGKPEEVEVYDFIDK